MPDLFFQGWQFICRIIPDNRQLDPKIDMGEDIAESGYLFPVGIRVPVPEFLREVFDRFTNNLKVTDDSIPSSPVFRKIIE